MKTNIELIQEVDAFPYEGDDPAKYKSMMDGIWTLVWADQDGTYPLGYILERVFQELLKVPPSIKGKMDIDERTRTVSLFHQDDTEQGRSARVAAVADYLRRKETFPGLKRWRNELWPVHGRDGEPLFSMERAAMGLLGTMRYGVHMTAYVKDKSAPFGLKMWVPRRAADKDTFPSMLDNAVAGGLTTGEDPFECIIREADEEAALPEAVVRQGAKCVGTVTYIYVSDAKQVGDGGLVYPECQWVYELELSVDTIPRPKDGEVAEFMLCDVDEIRRDLADGKFKPNCALVVLDFFIRHGILTDENETHIAQIQRRIKRDLPFPGPHQKGWKPQKIGSSV